MKRGLVGLALCCLCVIGLGAVAAAFLFVSIPDVTELKRCITTRQYQVRLCPSSPDFTPLEQISPYITGAVIMSEDASFYSHDGVDFTEMKEAALKDINEGRYARGASTITQQLAKNVFLLNNKDILRKLEEIYLALQIEKHFSKAKILALYLNVVEFGKNIYGVNSACQYYFHRAPADVTPEEAAFLAFLLPNPKKYSQSFAKGRLTPFANKMVRTILHKMELGHKISTDQYAGAITRVADFPWSEKVVPPAGVAPDQTPDTTDESDQQDNDFQFDFDTDDSVNESPTGSVQEQKEPTVRDELGAPDSDDTPNTPNAAPKHDSNDDSRDNLSD